MIYIDNIFGIKMRTLKDKVILSTLPHFIACYFAIKVSYQYATIIALSSIMSVIWHLNKEPKWNLLFYLDYGFALLWLIYDIMYIIYIKNLYISISIIVLNKISIITNLIHMEGISYDITHTIWHLLSSTKGILIAYMISTADTSLEQFD
jgi:hypothetical protein